MAEGIAFRETMQGWFALGQTDPQAGAREGERLGQKLALHATVAIPDLDRFMADRKEAGRLGGEIEFTPAGGVCKASRGLLQLFTPHADGITRRMVYELELTLQGNAHYLAGEKLVHDDHGFDLWSDTTTLYTRLHEGDRTGRVVGAGILRLGVSQLLAMVGSMEATGEGGVGTVMRFGRFFFGEIWNVYAPHVLGGKDGN